MALINPHINFNGNAEEAFNFYKSVFGGEFTKVPFFALPIGKNILIANDVPESMGRVNENENRSKISVSAESKEEADKVFNGLSAGKIESISFIPEEKIERFHKAATSIKNNKPGSDDLENHQKNFPLPHLQYDA